MARLTKYDSVRNCYVMRPDAKQGEHIQRLGKYEDMEEGKELVEMGTHGYGDGTDPIMCCGWCMKPIEEPSFKFCPYCGWKIRW